MKRIIPGLTAMLMTFALTEFEYLFDGQFKDKAVVRGTLTKMKRGEKIAERVLSFSMVRHGC